MFSDTPSASDPSLYTPNVAPNAPAGPPPGGYVPPPATPAPAGPPSLDAVVNALACASAYLGREAHDDTFRAALAEFEAPALASVRAALVPVMTPQAVLDAVTVCDFYGDFGGPLEDAFQDLLDEHADALAGYILRLAVGG